MGPNTSQKRLFLMENLICHSRKTMTKCIIRPKKKTMLIPNSIY